MNSLERPLNVPRPHPPRRRTSLIGIAVAALLMSAGWVSFADELNPDSDTATLGAQNTAVSLTLASGTSQTVTVGVLILVKGASHVTYPVPVSVSASGSRISNLSATSGNIVSGGELTVSVLVTAPSDASLNCGVTNTFNDGLVTFSSTAAGLAPNPNTKSVAINLSVAGPPCVSQLITFGALGTKTASDAPFTVSATASSGLTVTFSSTTTGVCTVAGSTVTLVAAGTCTIKADQAGNATYGAAPSVTQSFTVLQAQTITFNSIPNKTFGNAPFGITATASSGLPVTFSSNTPSVCTVAGSTVTLVAGGSCTIQADQAGNGTYGPAPPATRTFNVNQANQTITFNALGNKTYGDAPFTVSATASSGLTVTFSSTTTAVCTVSGTTVTIIAGGSCTIKADQAGNANYNAAPAVSRTFTVAAIAQTITFGALANGAVGDAPLTPTATASSGLTVTFTSTTTAVCTVSGSTVTLIAVGTCTIKADQAGNATYLAAPSVTQSFTVSQGSQTITFGALGGKTFGNAPFAVSATASSGLAVTFSSTTTGVCTVSGSTVTIVSGGTCTIKADQAGNANYSAAPSVSQSFTVAPASQTITFNSITNKTFGNAPFGITATASSGLTVTFTSNTPSVCTVAGSTVTLVGGGSCTIQADQAGNASYSAAPAVTRSFNVNQANQTITFNALGNKTFGDAPFTVSATASSGLTVTFSSTTTAVCTVSGTTVTLVAGGSCTIKADQAGNASYNAAPAVSRTFTVAQATQTITFPAITNKTFGDAPFAAGASASSGLTVAYTSTTTAVCTVAGSTVTIVAAGVCTIKADQAGDASYLAASSVSRSFTVGQASQTITFNALANKTFGNAPFAVSATASSGLAVTFSSTTTGVCTVASSTVTIVAGGTCTIKADQAGNANYAAASSVSQSFTVDPAAQTITFNALANKTFGNAPFAVSATATSGLTVTFSSPTTGVCTVSGTTVTLVGGGTCTIQADQAGNASYQAAPAVSRSFTVGPAAQTITFNALGGKTFGDAPFAVSATATSGLAVTFSSTTTGVCTVSGTTVTLVAGGTCTIQADQAGNASYQAAAPVSRSFTVAQAAQTITFPAITNKTYGDAPFGASATASSGLTVTFTSSTTSVCTVSGATVTMIAAGVCTIKADQAGNASYLAASSVSRSFTIQQATQTVTFNALGGKTFGDAPFGVSATASSGLTVTFSSTTTGVCTVSGSTVTIVAGGTCTIQADQAGNGNYLAAPAVSQSFTVAQAAQTVTFNALGGKTYGDAPFGVSATASSGLTVTFSSTTTGVCTVSGVTVTIVAGGTCTIQADQAGNGNYLAAPAVSRSFTVAQAAQTITFPAITNKTYGDAPFGASATASSGLTVTFSSSTTGVCTVAGSTVTMIAAGLCTVDADQAGNGNYLAASTVSRTFTVEQAAQSITFNALGGKTYGDAPFDVSATASSGLTVTFSSTTTGVCTVSGVTVTIVAGGTCTIKADQAGNGNYLAASSVSQSFTVAQAAQTITFNALGGKTYGDAPFGVSATASSGLTVTFSSTTTGVCTMSGVTVTIVAGGTCTIQADQAGNGNYLAAPAVSRSFTVAQAAQTITFAALGGKTYGDAPFGVSATASSGLTVTFTSATTGVCTVSGVTVTIVAAGTCTIEANQAGDGNYLAATTVSRSFTVAQSAQTITFGALADHTYGDSPFDVAATASSGLTVTFSSATTGVCTVSGVTVTIVAAGTCTIDADQAGNGNYLAAPTESQSFTVARAAQAIVLGAIGDMTFGDAPFGVSAIATSGLTVTFTSSTHAVCTVSGSTVTIVAAGVCTVAGHQGGNGNYLAAPSVARSFAVAQATQAILFSVLANKTFGDAPFDLSASASSGLAVSFSSTTPAVCTVSVDTVTIVGAGECAIEADQDGNANYEAALSVSRTFTVAKATQTIAFALSSNKTLDDSPIAVFGTATSGLEVTFTSATPAVCTVAGTTLTLVAVGECIVRADQAGDGNYQPAPRVTRHLTVSDTPVEETTTTTVSIDDSSTTSVASSTTDGEIEVAGETATRDAGGPDDGTGAGTLMLLFGLPLSGLGGLWWLLRLRRGVLPLP